MSHMRCRMIAAQASAESAKSLEIRAKYAANPRVQQPVQPVGRHCWCAMRRAVGNWIWLRFVKSWIWRVLLWEIGVLRGDFAKHNLETGTFPSTTRSILGVSEWFHGSESTRPTTIRITIFPTANLFGFNLWAGDWWEENAGAEKPEPCWNLPGTLPEPRYLPGTVLQRCWKFVGTFLEPSCWNCAGTFLEPLWNLLEPCWNCVRTVLELSWNLLGTFLELCWNLTGTMLEFLRFCFGDGAYSCGFEPEDKFRVLLFVFFRLCCLLRFVTFFWCNIVSQNKSWVRQVWDFSSWLASSGQDLLVSIPVMVLALMDDPRHSYSYAGRKNAMGLGCELFEL